jgi:hypothetical protein
MHQLVRPTEKQILGMIHFHESGVEYYVRHGQILMEAWSRQEAAKWRERLKAEKPAPLEES